MIELDLDGLRDAAGVGVAGNFAGHLEQAGEAGDFVSVDAPAEAPKGIFPWYVPGDGGFLGTFPLASDRVVKPSGEAVNLQIEPEVGVLAEVEYGPDGRPSAVRPTAIAAFDDCSVRREGAAKISHKKNWGPASKGLARRGFAVSELDPDGATASFRLACFLRRGGTVHLYGVDSPLPGYSYYGAQLLDWVADRLRRQSGAEGTPLEDVGALLAAARPSRVVLGIGATRYTPLGAATYLELGDDAIVVLYDGARSTPEQVEAAVAAGDEDALPEASVLRQRVVAA